ncbi:hypothetical protein [Actinoplanes sp. NPDC049265]|uniref:hypothetical protein n=1 Tax=Actinoplanes sp. NPDC049265 TaxID=3363902 RepID=UPI003722CCF2
MWDIRITRVFAAPRAEVHRAFAAPGQIDATFTEASGSDLLAGEAGGMRLRVEFHDEPDDRTRLILIQGPCPAETEGQVREAWSASFTQLDKVLARH